MSMIDTTPLDDAIAGFAASVRHHLDDLPAEEVDDLADGLEADVAEQAADSGENFSIPDAAAYAAELRAAAGLPERAKGGHVRRVLDSLDRAVAHRARTFVDALRAQPITAWMIDTLLALRPVWWLVRAGALYMLIIPFFPIPGGGWAWG